MRIEPSRLPGGRLQKLPGWTLARETPGGSDRRLAAVCVPSCLPQGNAWKEGNAGKELLFAFPSPN